MSLNALEAGASPAVSHDEEKALVSKVAWRLMPLIMVCYLFAFFDRINISFAKFQLQTDLSLSDTAYGLGAGLFVVGYVIFEVPSNMMLYKVGARRWIARIMMSWGLATAMMVFVNSEWQHHTNAVCHRRLCTDRRGAADVGLAAEVAHPGQVLRIRRLRQLHKDHAFL